MKKLINRIKFRIKKTKNKFKIMKKNLKTDIKVSAIINYMMKSPKKFFQRFKNSKNKGAFIVNFILSSKLMIVILVAILTAKAMLFYKNSKLLVYLSSFTFDITIIFLALLVSPLLFIKKDKNRFRWIMAYDIFFSIILLADNSYWKYSMNMLSISQIFYVKYAEEIGATLPDLLEPSFIYYLIDIPIILLLWFTSKKLLGKGKTRYTKNRGKRRIAIGLLFTSFMFVWTQVPIHICFNGMNLNPYLKLKQVGMGSIYGYHCLDIYNTINEKDIVKYKNTEDMLVAYNEINEYKKTHYEEDKSMVGIAKDKNVIVVQLESIQNFVINKTINGKTITPNLNKFLKENIEITNMTVQSYSTTADSEYSTMTSLYPLGNGQAFTMYYTNIANDIFSIYQKENYKTHYMHGNVGEFWNRNHVYTRLGIDEISFIDSFEDQSELIVSYLSDELFYKQAVEKLAKDEEKFFAYLVAASSHTPFDLEGIKNKEEKINIDVGGYSGTVLGNYLESVNYADYAFGLFIDELKANDLYEDSVILVFGDHAGLQMENKEMEEFIKQTNPEYNEINGMINYSNLACGIRIPGLEKAKIEKPISKIDIKPTLLQLSGIEDDFSLGMTMFSTKDYAYINNGRILLEKYYYDGATWYLIKTGEAIDIETLDSQEKQKLMEYSENVQTELHISASIGINNLLKNFEKN